MKEKGKTSQGEADLGLSLAIQDVYMIGTSPVDEALLAPAG
jgi:hypothetical protein